MRVKDLMTSTPFRVGPATSVSDARRLMHERRIRHVLVVEDGRLVGIVTDRDIRLNLPSPVRCLSIWELEYVLAKLTVGQIMTKRLFVVDPEHGAAEAAAILLSERIGALPVVSGGQLVGIVTETDFVRTFLVGAPAAAV